MPHDQFDEEAASSRKRLTGTGTPGLLVLQREWLDLREFGNPSYHVASPSPPISVVLTWCAMDARYPQRARQISEERQENAKLPPICTNPPRAKGRDFAVARQTAVEKQKNNGTEFTNASENCLPWHKSRRSERGTALPVHK